MNYIIKEDLFSKERTLKWERVWDDGFKEYQPSVFFPLINGKSDDEKGVVVKGQYYAPPEDYVSISFNWENDKPYVVLQLRFKIPSKKLKNGAVVVFVFDNDVNFSIKIEKLIGGDIYLQPFDFIGYDSLLRLDIKGVSISDVENYVIGEETFLSSDEHYCLPNLHEVNSMREHLRKYLDICEKDFGWKPETPRINASTCFSYQANSTCYVYLMQDNTNGYFKIGMSNNPEYREKTLQSEKPTISLLACHKYPSRIIAASIETALHSAFSEKRIRGEWFRLNDYEVWQIIESLK